MNALLSIAVWLALIMLSCCGHIAGHENEELTTAIYDDNLAVTGYEYGYINSAIYSNFPEAVPYIPNKASGIGQLNLLLLLGLAVLQVWH